MRSILSSIFLLCFSVVSVVAEDEFDFTFPEENLSAVYVKIARSLEHHGSPEPYIRWVVAEVGKSNPGALPDYFTEEYAEQLIGNWNKLEAPLQLDKLSREAGLYMRYAFRGSVHGDADEIVGFQSHLSTEKLKRYRYWTEKATLGKADMAKFNIFYDKVFDELNAIGQNFIRVMLYGSMEDPPQQHEIIKGMIERGTLLAVAVDAYGKGMRKEVAENRLAENDERYLESFILKEVEIDGTEPDYSKLHLNTVEQVYFAHLIKQGFEERIEYALQKTDAAMAAEIEKCLVSMAKNLSVLAYFEFLEGIK